MNGMPFSPAWRAAWTAGQVVRYYENIRIVYEIESRVQELRQSVEPPADEPPEGESEPRRPTGELERGLRNYRQHAVETNAKIPERAGGTNGCTLGFPRLTAFTIGLAGT